MRNYLCRCGDVSASQRSDDPVDAAEAFARTHRSSMPGDGPWLVTVQDESGGEAVFEVTATPHIVYVATLCERG